MQLLINTPNTKTNSIIVLQLNKACNSTTQILSANPYQKIHTNHTIVDARHISKFRLDFKRFNADDRLLHLNVAFLKHFVIKVVTNTLQFEAQGEKLTNGLTSSELKLKLITSWVQKAATMCRSQIGDSSIDRTTSKEANLETICE